jgi:hypothetical protein
MTMKTVPISSLLNGPQNHLGADCPMHGITYTSWTPKPASGQLTDCNPSVPHLMPRRRRTDQAGSGSIRRQSPHVSATAHVWLVAGGMHPSIRPHAHPQATHLTHHGHQVAEILLYGTSFPGLRMKGETREIHDGTPSPKVRHSLAFACFSLSRVGPPWHTDAGGSEWGHSGAARCVSPCYDLKTFKR